MTLRTLVVDDEPLPRQRVVDLVRADSRLELAGEAGDGAAALDFIVTAKPDLVFLDIQMPELDGFQVISALGDDPLPAFVFVTAYDEHAVRAFEVDAIDFLLKPITEQRFSDAVARVVARRDATRDQPIRDLASQATAWRDAPVTRFVARRGTKHYFVRVADIEWIRAEGNYVHLQTGETSHLIRETMKQIEATLDPAEFVRVHRSVFVAVDHIQSIEAGEHGEYRVTMRHGVQFISSRGYSERIRQLLR